MLNDSLRILSIDNLSVMRGESVLCQGVTLRLNQGDICHMVGYNGLGKTTLLMQLIGILPTITGQIDYLGASSAKGALYSSHQSGILDGLSVYQNLAFLLSLYGLNVTQSQLDEALAQVGLKGFGEVVCAKLSAGQKRRVALARLWLHTPKETPLWLLDEPLTALDSQMVAALLARLQAFAKAGGAVLLSSHQKVDVATSILDLALFVGDKDD